MSKGKKTFFTDSASVPSMQKTGGTVSIKKSANIPAMGQAPGTTNTSKSGGSGASSSSDNSGK
jgi:hypothetical protein